jgi:Concanavalin A-like lectin/glucanases superfamily
MNIAAAAANNGIGNAVNQVGNYASNAAASVKANVGDAINQFGSAAEVAKGSSEAFLQSNTMTAKIAFILLVLIVFSILIVLGVNLVAYFSQTPVNPFIVKGMIDGNNSVMLPGSLVTRSKNGKSGIEFTWSLWMQVNDVGNGSQQYQHVFNKGNGNYDLTATSTYPMGSGLATVTNAPGLYLVNQRDSSQMGLHVVMDAVDPNVAPMTMDVTGIPMNKKWMHVIIRLQNSIMDVYVNGTIAGRQVLAAVPKQNYGDIYVAQNGGFQGKISDLRYFAHALTAFEINQIVTTGPNTTSSSLAGSASKGSPYYLSSSWYFSKL